MKKYIKIYHDGLTANAVHSITVYRLTIVYSFIHTKHGGETHQHYFESNDGLLYGHLMDAVDDMSGINSIKIEKI